MKAKVRHLYEIIAGAILSLLGFVSCGKNGEDPYQELTQEYGMPHAQYLIKGTVTSEEGAEPLEGIKVIVRHGITSEGKIKYHEGPETSSDADGKVETSYDEFPSDGIEIVLEDVDGEENGGLFQKDTLRGSDVKIEKTKEGDNSWNFGTFTVAFTAKMKRAYTEIPGEYGQPHATYRIVGSVTDEDGNPIPGIEVLASLWSGEGEMENGEQMPKVTTDADGHFLLQEEWLWPSHRKASLRFQDVDGEENGGLFEDTTIEAPLEKISDGDGNWMEGTFGTSVDIQLKKSE